VLGLDNESGGGALSHSNLKNNKDKKKTSKLNKNPDE
jgi:hypothetical protein